MMTRRHLLRTATVFTGSVLAAPFLRGQGTRGPREFKVPCKGSCCGN